MYRLLSKVDKALADLERAIELCEGRGKVAEQAYTQRGLILMLQENEDKALEDFKVQNGRLAFRCIQFEYIFW